MQEDQLQQPKNDRSVEKEKEVMHEKEENKPATRPS
jgi:hypothetical protein